MHLIQAPGVGLEAADGYRAPPINTVGAGGVPPSVAVGLLRRERRPPPGLLRRARRPPPEWCRRTSSRHVLPLGLRRQPVDPAGLARKPPRVCLGVIPADFDHGLLAPTPTLVGGFVAVAA